MRGQIGRRLALHDVFTQYPVIVEVYADKGFTLAQDEVAFYVLTRNTKGVNTVNVYKHVASIYEQPCSVYFTDSELNTMLEGKKLIWRKGRWYV